MASVNFSGKYKLEKSENFEEMLKHLGVNFALRKVINQLRPVQMIEQEADGTFTFTTSSLTGDKSVKFKIGEEFVQEGTWYPGKYSTLAIWEGDQLVITFTPMEENLKAIREVREIQGEHIILTCTSDAVQCKRFFAKQD